jgi:hypothetical protein
LEKIGKKPTKVGVITIDVYEDSFEVKASDAIDMFTVYAVSVAVQEYLEELSETLDSTYTRMLQ